MTPHSDSFTARAIKDVVAERHRQIDGESFDSVHDDGHDREELARAAACYAMPLHTRDIVVSRERHNLWSFVWPFSREWWKPRSRREDLVRAAALCIAEIERLDRLTHKAHQ